ncbi:MAG TPA: bacillithiol biosynthesis deacetylase BshB1 [Steroidobacteraceae bacterium]|nr:bacillithiol biosynthesis deacetylase BshB1 [Steroidobacteraceae bacterium]
MSTVDILAIAAHPDDVELTCGGLLIRMGDLGYRTGVLDLTRGELGTRGSAEIRSREAAEAAKIMGLQWRGNADLPDSRLTLDDASRAAVAACIRRLCPTLVILPCDGQRHPDHNAACAIGYAGIFAAGVGKFPVEGAAHRPAQVLYAVADERQEPSFYIDITAQMERKLRAVAAYRSQFDEMPAQPIDALGDDVYSRLMCAARACGLRGGVRFAESYRIRQALLVDDPLAQLRLKPV